MEMEMEMERSRGRREERLRREEHAIFALQEKYAEISREQAFSRSEFGHGKLEGICSNRERERKASE